MKRVENIENESTKRLRNRSKRKLFENLDNIGQMIPGWKRIES